MTRALPPVGKCIYCGTTQPPLGKEHIIPFSLNGVDQLPEASCAECAKITGALEGYCLGKLLGPFRNAANFRTRKKGKRLKEMPLRVTYFDGRSETITLPVLEYPRMLHLPGFPIARALRGLPPDGWGDTTDIRPWAWCDKTDIERLQRRGIRSFEMGEMDPLQFARMIAKIAHATAVKEYGVDGFTPLAVDMILGRSTMMNYLVGCGLWEPTEPTEAIHTVSFQTHDETGMIAALVHLFAFMGAPMYHVLVGLKPGGRIAKVF